MRQRAASAIAIAVAAVTLLGMLLLSVGLASERGRERSGYVDAMNWQRRAAGRVPAAGVTGGLSRGVSLGFCVRGVETFASTLSQALPRTVLPAVLDDEGRFDVVAFRALSGLAVRAERYAEQATAEPALPQRLGRSRVAPSGLTEDGAKATWQPWAPARIPCAGGEAYRRFRLYWDDSAPSLLGAPGEPAE